MKKKNQSEEREKKITHLHQSLIVGFCGMKDIKWNK